MCRNILFSTFLRRIIGCVIAMRLSCECLSMTLSLGKCIKNINDCLMLVNNPQGGNKMFNRLRTKLGKKSRKYPIKRDEHGNEIWIPEEPNVLEIDNTAEGDITVKKESKTRIIDDQSREVPAVFAKWKQEEGIAW